MFSLFWKRGNKTFPVEQCRFETEEDLEKYIFKDSTLLGDIFLLKRQVRGGSKPGIPDIIGVDMDGNTCLVEVKNVAVGEWILPQILGYAIWAAQNPDSIRNLWLQTNDKPDLEPTFENVRVLVVAPVIEPTVLDYINTVTIPVDLIEIQRYRFEDEEFVAVNRLEQPSRVKVRPVSGLEEYDLKFYAQMHDKDAVVRFGKALDEMRTVVARLGFAADVKFNKNYAVFKVGYQGAFGIGWASSKTFHFYFKHTEAKIRELAPREAPMARYEPEWKQGVFKVDQANPGVRHFAPLMQSCLEVLGATRVMPGADDKEEITK